MTRKTFEGLGPGTLIPKRGDFPLSDPRIGLEEGFVLSRIDGRTSLAEVCLLVPFEEDVVSLLLFKLFEMGAIEVPGVVRVAPPKPPAKPPEPKPRNPKEAVAVSEDHGALNAAQVRRIDEVFAILGERDAFDLLGVTPAADSKDIKRAYFKLSKEFHPDRFYAVEVGDYGKKLSAIFQAVKAAFEQIGDDQRKAEYIESQG